MSGGRAAPATFSPVVMIAVVLVGVTAFLGIGVLSAFAPDLRSGDNGGVHGLSRSSTGFAAVVRLLRDTGTPVMTSRGGLSPASDDSLLVLTPDAGTTVDLEEFDHAGPILIVLPKWQARPLRSHPGWVETDGVLPAGASLSVLPEQLLDRTVLNVGRRPATQLTRRNGSAFGGRVNVEQPRELAGDQWTPVVMSREGGALLSEHRDGQTYVLSDPDLLNTQGLRTLEGAETAMALLALARADDSPVIFDLTLHGLQRSRSLLRLLIEPPVLGMTIALVALALFAGLQSVARFGPTRQPDRAVPLGKRALAENTAALVRLAGREPRMASPYARLVRGAALHAVGAPRRLDPAEADAFLDRIGAAAGVTVPYSSLAARAEAVKTPADLIDVARRLYLWKQELTRGRQ